MKRLDYFKLAMKAKLYKKRAWIISAFTVIDEGPQDWMVDPYPYRIVQQKTGVYFVDPDHLGKAGELPITLTKLEDALPGQPPFQFLERIEVGPDVCPSLTEPTTTFLGNLLVNLIGFVEAFGAKFPYQNTEIDPQQVEDLIASKLKDTPEPGEERSDDYYYVDELVIFSNNMAMVRDLSQICVYAATEKNIVAAPGIQAFKKERLAFYGDRIKDPVVLAQLEKELQAYDEQFIKDDPSYGVFLSGKVKNVSRKKMFIMLGAEESFKQKQTVNPILNSLEEGVPTDPEGFTDSMNGIRIGSYSRGAETVKGGVAAKILLRAIGNFRIVEEDCGTQTGIDRYFTTDNVHQLVGRFYLNGKEWVLVETKEQAQPLIGKHLIVRSPMYCLSEGDTICQHCAGQRLSYNKEGLSIAATEISSILLYTSMKAMHAKQLKIAKMNYLTALT